MKKGNELKPRIGFFGRRNVGKSTMINWLTGQQIAIVSDTAGTTTDPVRKSMEIGGIGPVVLIDTAGIDDEGELGHQRVEKSMAALAEVDLALLLYTEGCYGEPELMVERWCREHETPMLKVLTKAAPIDKEHLIEQIKKSIPESAYHGRSLLGGIVSQGDTVVLVTPIDSSAPEGRMILPQVQVLLSLFPKREWQQAWISGAVVRHPGRAGCLTRWLRRSRSTRSCWAAAVPTGSVLPTV